MDMKHLDLSEDLVMNKKTDLEIDLLLTAIYRLTGFDFRQYAKSSICRRVYNRMKIERIPTVSRLLEKAIHEEEFMNQLLNDFSINVTEMFRDPSFFKGLSGNSHLARWLCNG